MGWTSPLIQPKDSNFPTKQSIKFPLSFWHVEILVCSTGIDGLLKGGGKCFKFRTPYEIIVHSLKQKYTRKYIIFFISVIWLLP